MTGAEVEDVTDRGDLEEPLLRGVSVQGNSNHLRPAASNFWACVANVCKAVFGAGMMALPRACALLGSVLGLGLLSLVGVLTSYSISYGLIHPAASRLSRGRSEQQELSYSTLIRTYLGDTLVQLLNAFLLLNATGFSVMYLDVMSDVLIGSDGSPGILIGVLPVELLRRELFLGLLTALVIAPISLNRNIASLKWLNALGLLALAALGMSVTWLAGAAISQGKAFPMPLWPDASALDRLGGSRLMAALSPLPVVLAAEGCHMNILPMAASMTPFSKQSADRIVAVAMAACTLFYAVFAAASYVTFGPNLQEDMLKNLEPEDIAPLLGTAQAWAVAYTVRIAYTLSLLGSSALNLFPLRDAIFDVLFGSGEGRAAAQDRYFHAVTWVVLLVVYVLAVSIPSIWQVIGVVGSIASTSVCYLFPGLLMAVYQSSRRNLTLMHGAGAALVWFVGAFILVNGFVNPL